MNVLHITDNFTIKKFGYDPFFIIQNYHSLEYAFLNNDDAISFQIELDHLYNTCYSELELDLKLDSLCEKYV